MENIANPSDFILIGGIKPHARFLIRYTSCKLLGKVQKGNSQSGFLGGGWLDVGAITTLTHISPLNLASTSSTARVAAYLAC